MFWKDGIQCCAFQMLLLRPFCILWVIFGLDGPGIESRWGEIFRTRPDRPWSLHSLLYNGYGITFPGVKRPGRGVDHPPHLSPTLKKEYSYTSTPPLGLRDLFWGNLYLDLYLLLAILGTDPSLFMN